MTPTCNREVTQKAQAHVHGNAWLPGHTQLLQQAATGVWEGGPANMFTAESQKRRNIAYNTTYVTEQTP
eukprot:847368-Amphidinium_carterae.2